MLFIPLIFIAMVLMLFFGGFLFAWRRRLWMRPFAPRPFMRPLGPRPLVGRGMRRRMWRRRIL